MHPVGNGPQRDMGRNDGGAARSRRRPARGQDTRRGEACLMGLSCGRRHRFHSACTLRDIYVQSTAPGEIFGIGGVARQRAKMELLSALSGELLTAAGMGRVRRTGLGQMGPTAPPPPGITHRARRKRLAMAAAPDTVR